MPVAGGQVLALTECGQAPALTIGAGALALAARPPIRTPASGPSAPWPVALPRGARFPSTGPVARTALLGLASDSPCARVRPAGRSGVPRSSALSGAEGLMVRRTAGRGRADLGGRSGGGQLVGRLYNFLDNRIPSAAAAAI